MTLAPVFQRVLAHAAQAPGKAAIISGAGRLSWGELRLSIGRRAAALSGGFGVQRGDRVALQIGRAHV